MFLETHELCFWETLKYPPRNYIFSFKGTFEDDVPFPQVKNMLVPWRVISVLKKKSGLGFNAYVGSYAVQGLGEGGLFDFTAHLRVVKAVPYQMWLRYC